MFVYNILIVREGYFNVNKMWSQANGEHRYRQEIAACNKDLAFERHNLQRGFPRRLPP